MPPKLIAFPFTECGTSSIMSRHATTQQDAKYYSRSKNRLTDCFLIQADDYEEQQATADAEEDTRMNDRIMLLTRKQASMKQRYREYSFCCLFSAYEGSPTSSSAWKGNRLSTGQRGIGERHRSWCTCSLCGPCLFNPDQIEGETGPSHYNGSKKRELCFVQPKITNAEQRGTKCHSLWQLICLNTPQDISDCAEDNFNQEVSQPSQRCAEDCVHPIVSQPSQRAPEVETVSQENIEETLVLGELQERGTTLRYVFFGKQSYLPKSPVIGWYTCHQCLNLQSDCARKIVSSQALDIEVHAGQIFKAVDKVLPQTGSKRIFVAGTGWPDLTGVNVLVTPDIQDSDILMLLQRSVMLAFCDCLMITVNRIDRHQLQSLLQILLAIAGNHTTVIIFHYVENNDDFQVWNTDQHDRQFIDICTSFLQAQRKLIEEYLPLPELSDESHSSVECFLEPVLPDCFVPSRKMKLFHCMGTQEEAFSYLRRMYIESSKRLDSLAGRHCQGTTMQEMFHQTISTFAKLANLTERVNLNEEVIADGRSQLTVTVSMEK